MNALRKFVEEITRAGGKYSHLDGTQIVADAYAALRADESAQPQPAPDAVERAKSIVDELLEQAGDYPLRATRDEIFALKAALAHPAQRPVDGWQPIETAPKDGTRVFIWTGNDEFPNRWEASWREPTDSEYWVSGSDEPDGKETFGTEAGWFSDEGYTHKLQGDSYPTHWMPLPPAPIASTKGGDHA